ncbi:MAG: oxygen-independent coproporphyrinogen III oxidase-like protein [Betaproteobacteria bacterium]|nr:oxygen-independent coproporphyrinogen III oxidase-like protein [Betaproteobacteria bacterium]PWB57769.1 MAG: oxygen-independent coproporphyrinogen III oxidase-like protein [Betaproteobacteria bacterium]
MALPGRVRLQALPPLTLYVHIPWCLKKCPYCDFNSHEARGAVPETDYVKAVIADLEASVPKVWGRRVHAIFFGGGTPSLFSPASIERLLTAARTLLPVEADAEITLEANPGTFEQARFRDFRGAGVNRLSVGIQSFDATMLKAIGRVHDAVEAWRAAEIAMATFPNVNLDLMYALPGQAREDALADVRTAIGFGPAHVSAYHLTLEPNTLFHRYPPQLPDDDAAAAMQEAIEAELGAAGYENYETSAFAKPGMRSRHNLNYWLFGDYLGVGAGAHSKLSFPDRVVREARFRQPRGYQEGALAGNAIQESHEVDPADLPFEFAMNALRLAEGFPVPLFAERTGLPLSALEAPLDRAQALGLVERDAFRIRPTLRGRRFLNDLLGLFLREADSSRKV